MSASYESLSPNGHSSMITRIFQKIKSWVESVFQVKTVDITYAQYQQLSEAQLNDGTIRCIIDYPSTSPFSYDSTNKAIVIRSGTATYDSTNKALIL